MSNENYKKVIHHYKEVTMTISQEISKHTIQIFYNTNDGKQPYGTAILVKYQNHHFILSAAHVFEMISMPKLYFEIERISYYKTTTKQIGEYKMITTQKIRNERNEDKLDLAVLKLLSTEDIKIIESSFIFYDFEGADIDHTPIIDIPYYIAFGFPGSYTKLKNKYREESTREVLAINSSF